MHFIGIGGIGMSGIAEILINLGYEISGSDLMESEQTRRLRALGAKVFIGHKAENINDYHVVITSSAINASNPRSSNRAAAAFRSSTARKCSPSLSA
jgi:UDP-N-acetylmuramate--alanine ligase